MKWIKKNIQKITFRLTIKYTIFFFITLSIMSAITLFSVKYYIYNQSFTRIENINETIKHTLKTNKILTNVDINDISQMNENIDLIIRKNNKVVYITDERYDDYNIPTDKTKKPESIELGEKSILYNNEEFKSEDNDIFHIQIIKDMNNEEAFMDILFWILIIINIIAFLVSILLGFFMSKRALAPIEKITSQAKEISVSDLSKRIYIGGPDDELKRLAETFNSMISSIEYGYEKQNRFALDASHELATPLTVIKGYVDIVGRWGKDEPEILDEAIGSIKKEIDNMTKLLDKLLFLAKNDNEITEIEKTIFWLNNLIIEIIEENNLINKDISIYSNINEEVLVYADRRLIKQMLRAIIDNSIKYSKEACEIAVNSKVIKERFEISISDSGIGISQEDLPHIFDRFYRVDKARTREKGGTGLGLSIVKWIVEKHGGRIEAESVLGEGTSITISIPINRIDNIKVI